MNNLSILKITLRIFGVAFILIMPMMKLDPLGGWAWSPGQWEYEMMIQGVYMTPVSYTHLTLPTNREV